MYSKKYYILYGLFFSIIVSAILCIALTFGVGIVHIDPIFFLISFAIAFVTSFAVTAILPLARIGGAAAEYFDAKPGTVAYRLIQNIFISTIIMFFLGIVMTAFMTGLGVTEAVNPITGLVDPVNLFDRFAALCIDFWPTIIVVAFLSDPAAGGLAKLIVKPEQEHTERVEPSSTA